MARAILAVVVAAACGLAAPARADFELWTDVGASLETVPGVRIGLVQELRLDHDASELDRARPGAWVSWRAVKWLSVRAGYRYEIEPHYTKGADYADGWHEAYVDATLRRRLDRLRLSLRLRFLKTQGRPWDEDGALVRSYAARQKLELEWPLLRMVALVGSGELFLRRAGGEGSLDKWRGSAGVALAMGAHELSIRYLLERPIDADDETAHVLGLSYDLRP